ncbi:efflux RND transporter permease subunit [Thermincola ferriacetica]
MKLTDISLKRPVFATVIIIALVAVGIVSYTGLPINDMPDVDIPYVSVTIILPGASPDQVESKVSKKVEEALGQISGVKHLSTTITEGVSNTVVEFELEKSPDVAVEDVRTKLSAIRGELPQDIEEPIIAKFDVDAMPILSLAVTGPLNQRDLSELVDDLITKRLNAVKGVGSVNVFGDQEREIQIKLDKEKMASFGITPSEVVNSLRSDNLDIPSGKLSDGNNEITLRTYGSIQKIDDFNNILVAKRNGTEIRVGDIAEVIDGIKEKESLSYYKGKESIGIDIVKQSGGNTVEVAEDLKKEIAEIQSSLPAGVKIDIVRDNSVNIRNTVDNVLRTIIEGCVLTVLIVFLFLGDLGSTAISAISLPTSIITTFTLLKIMDFSLNTMSLAAISLAVGLLVDDAIVVIENIVRHLHMGKTPLQAAKDGTSEIGLAVMATTFAVVAVFLPIAMVSGIIGKFFKQFGMTVAFSLLVSLFVSFALIPLLSARFVKHEEEKKKGIIGRFIYWFNHIIERLADYYKRFLKIVLHHRLKTLAVAGAIFIASLGLFPLLGTSFVPTQDMGEINIEVGLDSGLTLEMAGEKAKTIESILQNYPQIRYIYTTVKPDSINLFVKLSDKQEREESIREISNRIRQDLQRIPGIDLAVNISGGMTQGKEVQYHLKGNNFDQLQKYAVQVKRIMETIPGTVDVGISYKAGKPETKLEVNRDKAADLGVSTAAVGDTLRTLFNGIVVSQYETDKDRYDVRVSIKDDQRQNLDSFSGIYVPAGMGASGSKLISLDQVTNKVFATSSSTINRYDKAREIQVSANLVGISQGDFNNLFMEKVNKELGQIRGVSISVGGNQERMQEGFQSMGIALLMGVLFIFLVLAAQFESYLDPLAIMFSLPLAMIGAILALFLTGSEFSLTAMIGIIMLMGLVAKNAILLIDFTKQQRSMGVGREEALLRAGNIRLRPILMTSLAMIFGMLPTAIAVGNGSEMRAPMAYAIIGGLISSTILTLLVVPVIYTLLDDLKGLFKKQKSIVSSTVNELATDQT